MRDRGSGVLPHSVLRCLAGCLLRLLVKDRHRFLAKSIARLCAAGLGLVSVRYLTGVLLTSTAKLCYPLVVYSLYRPAGPWAETCELSLL